ncbi:MAG: UDP-galactopyranose mutase [Bacteroidales bacterium]|nr:UDP-galactopyranose mutase [Bacteroidales bacterium]
MEKYDFLIVGSGLFGSTFACKAKESGKNCLVIDKRGHVGGNVFCEKIENINVHKYGAHIFHTSDKYVWDFVNKIVPFNNYRHSVLANNKGRIYNLPFNMNTFYQLWGVTTPKEAKDRIEEQRKASGITNPKNLEEQAVFIVGKDIYETLIKEYTEKQWGRKATELPPFIIERIPVRFVYDNNYYNDTYQGIPIGGYNKLTEGLLAGIEVRLNSDYFQHRNELNRQAKNIVFTGCIDEYFDYKFGKLDYRSLRFETEIINSDNFQGCSVVNYSDAETPFTRIIEHKHFEYGTQPKTVITREFSEKCEKNSEKYYPINDARNNSIFEKYNKSTRNEKSTFFGGRLAEYKYYDMNQVVEKALKLAKKILS